MAVPPDVSAVPPPGTATPRTIVRNAAANAAATVYMYLTGFFLVPVILHALGPDVYGGLWAIVGALTLSLGLLDLGAGTAYVAFIAERSARGDDEGVNTVVASGLAAGALLGGLILAVALLGGDLLLDLAGVRPAMMEDARFVLRVSAAGLFLVNLLAPVTSILSGFQRIDLQSALSAGTQTLAVAGALAVLGAGFGVRGLALSNLAAAALGAAATLVAGRRIFPALRISVSRVRPAVTTAMLVYGMNLFLSRLADIATFQIDRILALRFFGPAASTTYDVSARLTGATRAIAGLLLGGLTPAFAGVDAREGRGKSLALYRRTMRYLVIVAAFLFGFVIARSEDLLGLWLGPGVATSPVVVRLLAAGYFLNIITGAASAMAAGVGATDLYRRYGILVTVILVPLAFGGAMLFGLAGVAAGSALTLAVGGGVFIASFHRRQGLPVREIGALAGKPVLAAAAAAVAAVLVVPAPDAAGRMDLLVPVILAGLVYTGVYLAGGVALRMLRMGELRQIGDLFLRRGGAA